MFSIKMLAEEIARRSSGRLTSLMLGGAEALSVTRFAPIESATPEHVAFIAQPKLSKAGVIVMREADREAVWGAAEPDRPMLITRDPYAWFAWALQVMTDKPVKPGFIHPRAVVDESAQVDPSARIEANAVIGAGARIGARTRIDAGVNVGEGVLIAEDCHLYPNVVVYAGCRIGARSIIHSGAVIGADGFGFAPFAGEWVTIPQVGAVTIGEDVEIGANTTIDRGALEDTVVGKGTKLDNLIQLGHNVRIGEYTAMAACTGVAGSTHIGSHCVIAGAANISGHIEIPDMSIVGPATTITSWEKGAKVMMGYWPAQERPQFERTAVMVRRIGDLRKKVRELDSRLEEYEKKSN